MVSVRERSTLDILTAQTNVMTIEQDTADGHGFTERPVDFAALEQLGAVLEDALQAAVKGEAFG